MSKPASEGGDRLGKRVLGPRYLGVLELGRYLCRILRRGPSEGESKQVVVASWRSLEKQSVRWHPFRGLDSEPL